MASFITAGNATNGLQVSSDNTGILELRTGTGSGTTAVTFSTGQRATFPSTISVGNTTPATTGAGITFPAAQSASSDANTLDDYEEGTWTPIDSSGASLSFTNPEGYYVKIGRQVTAWGYVVYPSTANGSNSLIGGLPFIAANQGSAGSGGMIGYSSESTFARILGPINGSTVVPYTSAGGRITNATFSTDSLYICLTYFV